MSAGKRNRLVTIQQQSTTQDVAGQPANTWTTFAQVWAGVRFQTGAEAMKADAPTSAAKAVLNLLHRTDVTAGMRITLGTTVFEIRAVLPDHRSRQEMQLVCEVIG